MKGDRAVVFCASPFKVIAASGNSTQRFRFGLGLFGFGLKYFFIRQCLVLIYDKFQASASRSGKYSLTEQSARVYNSGWSLTAISYLLDGYALILPRGVGHKRDDLKR